MWQDYYIAFYCMAVVAVQYAIWIRREKEHLRKDSEEVLNGPIKHLVTDMYTVNEVRSMNNNPCPDHPNTSACSCPSQLYIVQDTQKFIDELETILEPKKVENIFTPEIPRDPDGHRYDRNLCECGRTHRKF